MKIELEIPDWIEETGEDIYIHAGTELVAKRYFHNKKWFVKTGRCCMCGDCCRGLSERFPYRAWWMNDKSCIYLKDNKCMAGIHKPFSCIMDFHDDPELKPKKCTEIFKET